MPSAPPTFQPFPRSSYDADRRESLAWRKWYGTQRWRKRRAAQLLAEPLCTMCLAEGIATAATVADHVEPHRGDAHLFWNGELQSLCASHHNAAKQRAERAAR